MNYLQYIELSAENLQFFLWFRDYSKRFSELPQKERILAPEWVPQAADAESPGSVPPGLGGRKLSVNPDTNAIFNGTSFATEPKVLANDPHANPFHTPPRTPDPAKDKNSLRPPSARAWSDNASTLHSSSSGSFQQKAVGAFEAADVKVMPCMFQVAFHGKTSLLTSFKVTIQPFREEINRVISIYVADGGQRQLNLSSKERARLLTALASTTHPSAFSEVVHTVEWSLRRQAHPNFIRWSICNGNPPRQWFARGLGVFLILAALVSAVMLTMSKAGRGWRAVSAIGFVLGISTLIAAWKGMCVVLHGLHHRHLRPWELFADDDESRQSMEMEKTSFDSFGSAKSYEDEPWVAKYEKRNVLRKILDREVWIQEPALRQIQDTIFLQAMAASLLLSAILVGIFVAIPQEHMF